MPQLKPKRFVAIPSISCYNEKKSDRSIIMAVEHNDLIITIRRNATKYTVTYSFFQDDIVLDSALIHMDSTLQTIRLDIMGESYSVLRDAGLGAAPGASYTIRDTKRKRILKAVFSNAAGDLRCTCGLDTLERRQTELFCNDELLCSLHMMSDHSIHAKFTQEKHVCLALLMFLL